MRTGFLSLALSCCASTFVFASTNAPAPVPAEKTSPEASPSPSPLPAPSPSPSSPAIQASGISPQVEFERAEKDTLYFRIPKDSEGASSLKTSLFDFRHIGTLYPSEGGLPYFIFAAKPCQNCMQDAGVHLIRPQEGMKPMSFVYPGRILDSGTRSVLLESRAFFGRCLKHNDREVYLVFQREKVDRRHGLQASVFIAEPGKDRITERLIERRLPSINDTLRLVKSKQCKEVDPRYRVVLRKPLDLRYSSQEQAEREEKDEK